MKWTQRVLSYDRHAGEPGAVIATDIDHDLSAGANGAGDAPGGRPARRDPQRRPVTSAGAANSDL
jgi:hypothetical protein